MQPDWRGVHEQIAALTDLLRACAKMLRRIANEGADGATAAFMGSANDLDRSADEIDRAAAPVRADDIESPDQRQ